jgi:hypothetical protein
MAVRVVGTNEFAIVSFVLGAVWCLFIGSVLAVIFGHIARHQIATSGGTQPGRGLAIAGLALGWTGVAVLAICFLVAALA